MFAASALNRVFDLLRLAKVAAIDENELRRAAYLLHVAGGEKRVFTDHHARDRDFLSFRILLAISPVAIGLVERHLLLMHAVSGEMQYAPRSLVQGLDDVRRLSP